MVWQGDVNETCTVMRACKSFIYIVLIHVLSTWTYTRCHEGKLIKIRLNERHGMQAHILLHKIISVT